MFYDKGYPVKSIGDVVDRKIARVAKVFSKTDEIQYLDISSIDNASKTVTGLTPYTLMDAPSRAQYVLAKDDIVYSTVRPNLQNIAINPYEEENVVGSTGFCVLRCTGVSTGYMWGVVNSTLFTDTMINKASGANYPAVTDKVVLAYEIPIPPEDQQLAYEHLVRQSDKSKFVRFKSQFIEMFGDPIDNEKDWPFELLPNVTTIVLGSTPRTNNDAYWDGDIKWISPAELSDESFYVYDTVKHITEEGVKSAGLKSFPANTVLFSTRAPIGKTAIAGCEMYCNQGFKNFICGPRLNPVYLYYLLRHKKEHFQSLGSGTTFRELSRGAIEKIAIAVPDMELQDRFEKIFRQSDKSK